MREEIPYVLESKNKRQPKHEFPGHMLSALTGGLIGAGIGGGVGSVTGEAGKGALIGGLAGAFAPSVVAGLAAIIAKKRRLQEQKAYQESSPLQNYIPGMGMYNAWKALGVENSREYQNLKQKKYKDPKWRANLPQDYKRYIQLMDKLK